MWPLWCRPATTGTGWWSTPCATPGPGLRRLSGIPGSTGATPVQNVGAYGAEVSQTIAAVRTWDRERNAVQTFTNSELKFGYRDSILKRTTVDGSPRYVVLTVEFQLPLGRMSAPIRYAELARSLGVEVGKRAYANDVRREVLRLRASKGMVLGPRRQGHVFHRFVLHQPHRSGRGCGCAAGIGSAATRPAGTGC